MRAIIASIRHSYASIHIPAFYRDLRTASVHQQPLMLAPTTVWATRVRPAWPDGDGVNHSVDDSCGLPSAEISYDARRDQVDIEVGERHPYEAEPRERHVPLVQPRRSVP